jgi:hypothetical protein
MTIPDSAHRLPDGRVRVVFEQRLPPYAAGEDAGFEARYAEELVDRRIARFAKPGEVIKPYAGIPAPEATDKRVHCRVLSRFGKYSKGDEPVITLAEFEQAAKRGWAEKISDFDVAAHTKRREAVEREKAEEMQAALERRAFMSAPTANKAPSSAPARK